MQTSFETLKLKPELQKGLKAQNITSPTPIQSLTYPAFLEGNDLMVESHTGSGKTLAFLLPLFEKINPDEKTSQAIILAPTHELAHQIHEQIKRLAKNSDLPITSALLMGEMNIDKQIIKLREKPHILVGSPGRILDLILKKKIHTATVETIILDEADNLLETSQSATVKKLLHQLSDSIQITMFSASMTAKVKELAVPFLKTPKFLHTADQTVLNPDLEHLYATTTIKEKFDILKKLLVATNTPKALVFVSQHTDTKMLVEKLKYHGFTVATISGKLSKEERKEALTQFKSGKVRILLSSDLSARGLDVAQITHVFHYDLPLTAADYLHRAGRSARNGEKGTSISILTPRDLGLLGLLERTFKIKPSEVILVKGRMKNLVTNSFIEPLASSGMPQKESSGKSRNKYPKGFSSNKKEPVKASDSPKKAQPLESPRTLKRNLKQANPLPSMDDMMSGTLTDALKLIEESGFED